MPIDRSLCYDETAVAECRQAEQWLARRFPGGGESHITLNGRQWAVSRFINRYNPDNPADTWP